MKIKFTLILVILSLNIAAQPWSKIYDFGPDISSHASENTAQYADTTFFLAAGNTVTDGISTQHSYLAKMDYHGDVLQSKMLYFPGKITSLSEGPCIAKISSNKYVLVGSEEDNDINPSITVCHSYLYIFDENLDSIRFVKLVDPVISYWPHAVTVDDQKNIIVAGFCSSNRIVGGNYDAGYYWIAKYDSNANLIWSKRYLMTPVFTYQTLKSIVRATDGNGYVAGGIYGANSALNVGQNFVMKVDNNGNLLWHKLIDHSYPYGDSYIGIVGLKDGNYAFATEYSDSLLTHPWLGYKYPSPPYLSYGKFDNSGNFKWQRHFRKYYSSVYGRAIVEGSNGDLIMYAVGFSHYDRNIVTRVTNDGDIRSYREYETIDNVSVGQGLVSINYTPQHKLLLSGVVNFANQYPGTDSTGQWSWFVLTDSFSCLVPGCEVEDTMWHTGVQDVNALADINIYPNPAHDVLHVDGVQTEANLTISDITGRQVYKAVLPQGSATIDIDNYTPGAYLLQLRDKNGNRLVRKIIKE